MLSCIACQDADTPFEDDSTTKRLTDSEGNARLVIACTAKALQDHHVTACLLDSLIINVVKYLAEQLYEMK